MALVIIASALVVLAYVYAIVDLNKRRFKSQREKANWLTLIFFFPFFGVVIYLLNRKRRK
jgi:uncharacterized membrane protein YhaH (DUF805 family)